MRHWVVTVIGLAFTLVLVGRLWSPDRVYWSRVVATVRTPPEPAAPRTLADRVGDPIPAATLLAMLINKGVPDTRAASPEATLYGEGRRSAVSARVRNVGGQWSTSVREPLLDVEVVDVSAALVSASMAEQMRLLADELRALQDRLAVPPAARLTLDFTPAQPEILEISASRARAVGAAAVLGLSLTATAVYWTHRWRGRRDLGQEAWP